MKRKRARAYNAEQMYRGGTADPPSRSTCQTRQIE